MALILAARTPASFLKIPGGGYKIPVGRYFRSRKGPVNTGGSISAG
jgi:hypothetical protein